jgi:DNA-binding GntR family transcriptional regulator
MAAKRYPDIAEDLAARIDAGEFGEDKDYQIPTEKELVKHYRCSNRSVTTIVNILEAHGYIYSVYCVGRFLTPAKIKELEKNRGK